MNPKFTRYSTILAAILLAVGVFRCSSADDASPAAGLIKLLESGRVPPERIAAIVDQVAKRGDAGDLAYLFQRAAKTDGFAADVRLQALQALAEAHSTRNAKPSGDLSGLRQLIQPDKKGADAALQTVAVRLAGNWKVDTLADALAELALAKSTSGPLRKSSVEALANIGGKSAGQTFDKMSAKDQPRAMRLLGAAGLARLDPQSAAKQAAAVLAETTERDDPAPLLDTFLAQKGGAKRLAAAVKDAKLPVDAAKLALRHLYSIGRTDAELVAALTAAAGIRAQGDPPTKEQLERLVAEVRDKGDAERGERIFRRADLSCMKCHAVSKAGGTVGPDLSAVGSISPVDYVLTSILQPDLAVKENYLTANVLTVDGQVHQGIIVEEGGDVLVLKDAEGRIIKIPHDEENQIRKGGSLMPKGLVDFLTHQELLDLARFISELGKPGPYAVRSTPTIQRYQVLNPLPEALRDSAPPDDAAFTQHVLRADPSAWKPAYAKVAGALPLAELTAATGGKALYLQAAVKVTAEGEVGFALDSGTGVQCWLDEKPYPAADKFTAGLTTGTHMILFRIDTTQRTSGELRAELFLPEGSTAEFTVVDGQ